MEKIVESLKKGARDKDLLNRELPLFQQMRAALEEEQPISTLQFSEEQIRSLRGYGLMTVKPMLVIVNEGEEAWPEKVTSSYPTTAVVTMKGKIEAEIAELPRDEAKA